MVKKVKTKVAPNSWVQYRDSLALEFRHFADSYHAKRIARAIEDLIVAHIFSALENAAWCTMKGANDAWTKGKEWNGRRR